MASDGARVRTWFQCVNDLTAGMEWNGNPIRDGYCIWCLFKVIYDCAGSDSRSSELAQFRDTSKEVDRCLSKVFGGCGATRPVLQFWPLSFPFEIKDDEQSIPASSAHRHGLNAAA